MTAELDFRWMRGYSHTLLAAAVTKAFGQELQVQRQNRGLDPLKFVERVPSHLDLADLFVYEQGLSGVELWRLVEFCMTLDISLQRMLVDGMRRAHALLAAGGKDLEVSLPAVLKRGKVLPNEPAVQLAQAHRLAGHYDYLSQKLHAAHQRAEEQARIAAQAVVDRDSARQRADMLARMNERARANFDAYLEAVEAQHRSELRDRDMDHRQVLVEEHQRHAAEVAALISSNRALRVMLAEQRVRHAKSRGGRASAGQRNARRPALRPMTGEQARKQRLVHLELRTDADPAVVKLYHWLLPGQRRLLRVLAASRSFGEFARWAGVEDPKLRREVAELAEWFGEPTYVGLAELARELFTEQPGPE